MTSLASVRKAIVTGAGSGMGRVTALHLAERGARVIAVDRHPDGLTSLVSEARGEIVAVTANVADSDVLASALTPHLGDVDLLVCAAGIGHTGRFVDTPFSTIRRLVEVNLLGTAATVHTVLPGMLARKRGHVVMYASMAGLVPAPQHAPYNSTKAGVIMLAESLRLEVAPHGVQISAVCPPAVATPLLDDMPAAKRVSHGLMRPLRPEQVVLAVERGIERDRFFIHPNALSHVMHFAQRHAPWALAPAISRLVGA